MNCFWISILMTLLLSWLFLSHASKASLVFEKEPKNVIAVTGKKVSFSCRANATGKEITYFWKLNGSFLNEDNTDGLKISNGLLQINNVTGAKHQGAYECIAYNKDLGSIKSRIANLKIAYFSGKPRRRVGRFSYPSSYMIDVSEYKAFPAPTITWQYLISWPVYSLRNISDFKRVYVTVKGSILIPTYIHTYTKRYTLKIFHPAVNDGLSPALTEKFWTRFGGNLGECPDSAMRAFPTVTNKTVGEGSSVFFECFVVPKSCDFPISVSWTKAGRNLNETSRRLVLKNVTKMGHEGTYQCHAKVMAKRTSMSVTYSLTVVERPKLVKALKPIVSLPANGILHPAVVDKTASIKWYKDGSVIDNSSILFDVFPNGNLKMKYPSPAFNGIYQMVYENQAGTTIVSQTVTVNSEAGCGWKIITSSGTVSYTHTTPTWSDTICTWFFQLPSTELMKFRIRKFSLQNQATFSIYEGSMTSKGSLGKYFFNVAQARGPFISLVLRLKALSSVRFTVDYWPMSQGPPTTSATKSSKMKPTASKPTTSKPTANKPTANKPTTTKPTKQKPVKAKQKGDKGGLSAGAVVGLIIGALVLIALILLVIYREKVLRKCGHGGSANVKATEPTSTPMFEVDTPGKTC